MYLIHMRFFWLSTYVLTAFCADFALRTATQLGSFLSPQASIYLPGSSSFDTATQRWQDWQPRKFLTAVEVATVKDVQRIVQFANLLNLPFLARTGGRGSIGSLGKLNHGIEIWMRKQTATEIAEDGQTVQLGGGLLAKEITDALWAEGKQTVTGLCEFVGNVGAMLGGGHGILQGRYGLVADNLLSAEVVLANGSLATASSTSHTDLFWALRGAGHNFGIVTSYRFRIYDVPPDNSWTLESYVYTEDKLEQVLELTNTFAERGKQPVDFHSYNITAHRAAFGIFEQHTREYPGLNGSYVMNEGYSLKGVQNVAAESTAYLDRDGKLLM
ncbi:MAG: hypothetical protein Q9173_006017 [Seirophora scorigena]